MKKLVAAGALFFFCLVLGPPVLVLLAAGSAAGQGFAPPVASADAADAIPPDLLGLYQQAATDCAGLSWTVLAAIGWSESRQASPSGRYPIAAGLGWAWHGVSSAGAEGPMQFMPQTWAAFAVDADGDGVASPEDPVDAVHAAARYLCSMGAGDPARLRQALLGYSGGDQGYADRALERAGRYGGLGTFAPPEVSVSGPSAADLAAAGLGGQVAAYALSFQGVPYVWGGTDPSGFDCSGLAVYAYARFGVALPRVTTAQFAALPHLAAGVPLEPGDLLFFQGRDGPPPGHEGIYIGGGLFVEAPKRGDVVRVSALSGRGDYMGAVRPLAGLASGAP